MSETTYDETRTGFHPVNIGHLVMGVALLGLLGVWALWQGGVVADHDVRWLMPVPWVAAGITGLVATAITGTRRHGVRQTGWVAPAVEPTAEPTVEPTAEPTVEPTTEPTTGTPGPTTETEEQP